MAFSNNQQSLLWMGFLPLGRQASTPAYRQAGLPAVGGANVQNGALTDVILNPPTAGRCSQKLLS